MNRMKSRNDFGDYDNTINFVVSIIIIIIIIKINLGRAWLVLVQWPHRQIISVFNQLPRTTLCYAVKVIRKEVLSNGKKIQMKVALSDQLISV